MFPGVLVVVVVVLANASAALVERTSSEHRDSRHSELVEPGSHRLIGEVVQDASSPPVLKLKVQDEFASTVSTTSPVSPSAPCLELRFTPLFNANPTPVVALAIVSGVLLRARLPHTNVVLLILSSPVLVTSAVVPAIHPSSLSNVRLSISLLFGSSCFSAQTLPNPKPARQTHATLATLDRLQSVFNTNTLLVALVFNPINVLQSIAFSARVPIGS
ncbi:hypothetical protein R3P38DRAFT_3195327 [Favolaschia claudopus]|uniref:Secreted protein n=1 Tax=Favolaschia claudopus TaxID=2862362 RepID=A0AAW0BAK2_9AGAR